MGEESTQVTENKKYGQVNPEHIFHGERGQLLELPISFGVTRNV